MYNSLTGGGNACIRVCNVGNSLLGINIVLLDLFRLQDIKVKLERKNEKFGQQKFEISLMIESEYSAVGCPAIMP